MNGQRCFDHDRDVGLLEADFIFNYKYHVEMFSKLHSLNQTVTWSVIVDNNVSQVIPAPEEIGHRMELRGIGVALDDKITKRIIQYLRIYLRK